MSQQVSAHELESFARQLTQQSLAVRSRIQCVVKELALEKEQVTVAQRDYNECCVRMQEIDKYMDEIGKELEHHKAALVADQQAEQTQLMLEDHDVGEQQCSDCVMDQAQLLYDLDDHEFDDSQGHDEDCCCDCDCGCDGYDCDCDCDCGLSIENYQEELNDLVREKQDEQVLLQQIQIVLQLHLHAASSLEQLLVRLVKQLRILQQKEKLLVTLAFKTHLVKIVPRKNLAM